MPTPPKEIKPATGKLGVLLPGLGAVSTTFITGVKAIIKGLALPIGSLTQLGNIRVGMRDKVSHPKITEFVPLSNLSDLVFGTWDIFEDNCYQAASKAGVLDKELLDQLREELELIKPMKAVFSKDYVKKLDGSWVKKGATKMDLAQGLIEDINRFKEDNGCDRLVMVWCGSTEIYLELADVHKDIESFEKGLRDSDHSIAPSMIYAYAALKCGVPFANGAPNLTVDLPAMRQMSKEWGGCIAGKDFKTGQTLMKTIIAPGLRARLLGIDGWFSTNILGNRDGEVLDDPESFHTKEVSKLGALEHILQPDLLPELYGNLYHKVRINYYPPRGDNKEGWDNIDIRGWLGYKMQIKVDFLCRDSILAAPIVLDLALFMDLAARCGMKDIQEWLSFYFKSPMVAPNIYPEHSLHVQLLKLKNTLRWLKGEMQLTHLGIEYYD